jgi:lysophospholipase L1-like esterase
MNATPRRPLSIDGFPLTGRAAGCATSSRATRARAPVNFLFSVALVFTSALAAPMAIGAEGTWTTAWGVAPLRNPIEPNIQLPKPPKNLPVAGQTVREVLTVGAGGTHVRLHLDNRYGAAPVDIGAITVARVAEQAESIDVSSLMHITVHGKRAATLPAQGAIDTDALPFELHAGQRLAVSLYVPGRVVPASWHTDSRITQTLSGAGDHTGDVAFTDATTAPGYDWLTRVDVMTAMPTPVLVTLGDSITNGFRASLGNSYPEQVAARLADAGCVMPVINMGIDGNQVAGALGNFGQGEPMLQRLSPDVLSVSGARFLLLLGGINDIGEPTMAAHAAGHAQPDANTLATPVIAALQRIAERAKQYGLTVYGATLPPFGGTENAFTPQGEAARQAINGWVRRARVYQGVADFDAVLRDPAQPERMQTRFDSGDHIHPNDEGYRAMARAVPLAWLGCQAGHSSTSRKQHPVFKRTGTAGE